MSLLYVVVLEQSDTRLWCERHCMLHFLHRFRNSVVICCCVFCCFFVVFYVEIDVIRVCAEIVGAVVVSAVVVSAVVFVLVFAAFQAPPSR